jgi:hypothetical protein
VDHEPLGPSPQKTYFEDVVKIPGYGEAPNRCRDYSPVGFCDVGHVILGRSSCGTRYCPDHWRDWLENAVVNMVARMAAYREGVDGAEKRCSHVVASPPQDRLWSSRELWETRSDAREALDAAGVRGGAMVVHPYRTNDRGDRLFDAARAAGAIEERHGKWKFLRGATEGWDGLREYVEASPHYHTLAMGADIDGSAAPEGWVVERVRSFQRFHRHDMESYEDMVATAYYVLTHGAVQDGRQTLSYFGAVHPSTFDPEEELTVTAWETIKRYAERAVKGEDRMGEGEAKTCPIDGCDATVHDLLYWDDYLTDDDWMERIRLSSGGQKKWLQLRGLRAYVEGRTDRPPPHAVQSQEGFRDWLEKRGQVFTKGTQQVGLPTA